MAGYNAWGSLAGTSRSNATLTNYGYDAVQRPNAFYHDLGGSAADGLWTFARNPAGQIASHTRENDAYAWTRHYAVSRVYTSNGLNRYSQAGSATFGYDANGNLTSEPAPAQAGGTRTFSYDIENRLVGRSGGVTLAYDPLGRLYEVSGASGTTRFLYDGDALVAEYNGAGAVSRRYVHWTGADVPMLSYADTDLSQLSQLHADERGSIIAITDGAGIAAINAYDEYGIPAVGNTGRFQYTGQIWIAELGMYHYKARVYSPSLGRFMQTDPIGYDDQFNLYAYVGNDPVNNVDPDGKCGGPIGRVCQIVATRLAPVLARLGNSIARLIPGTSQRAQAVAQAAQQRLQQSNLAQHPAGWNAINSAKQAAHTVGTAREGASVLTTNATRIFNRYAGLGEAAVGSRGQPGFRERITTGGNVIGQYVNPAGTRMATDSAIIHYGRTGSHIVPSAPSAMLRMVPGAQ